MTTDIKHNSKTPLSISTLKHSKVFMLMIIPKSAKTCQNALYSVYEAY